MFFFERQSKLSFKDGQNMNPRHRVHSPLLFTESSPRILGYTQVPLADSFPALQGLPAVAFLGMAFLGIENYHNLTIKTISGKDH